jgi:Tfp pilus assembly PilM family ATPase
MPPLIALEWNNAEARVAAASKHGNQVVIEQALAIPLRAAGKETEASAPDVGARIAEALAAHGLSRADVLVAVSRANIELRQLQVPNVPDDEMPEIVRMQAMREFNELDENWPLDFVPIDEGGEGPRHVLATAIAPQLVKQIEGVCQRASLKMRRLVLRSCGAASLLARAESGRPSQVRLLVDLLADEADLTVMIDGKTIFLRTTRLSGDPPQSQALLAEIRLTMAAVQNQLGGRKVTLIVLCGGGEAHAALARQIEQELGTSVKLFDPFEGLQLGRALSGSPPENPGRFAPLLGVLLAELEQTGQAIDFLHPRRPPDPPTRGKKWGLAGALVGTLVIGYLVYSRIDNYLLSNEVANLTRQERELSDQIKAWDKKAAPAKSANLNVAEVQKWIDSELQSHKDKSLTSVVVEEVKKWAESEVLWLDQLRELSKDFPPAENAVLGQLAMSSGAGGAGEMRLKGAARNAEAIAAVEESLRAHDRKVIDRGSREDRTLKHYSWRFDTSVILGRETKQANTPRETKP